MVDPGSYFLQAEQENEGVRWEKKLNGKRGKVKQRWDAFLFDASLLRKGEISQKGKLLSHLKLIPTAHTALTFHSFYPVASPSETMGPEPLVLGKRAASLDNQSTI